LDGDEGVPIDEAAFSIYARNAAGEILLAQHYRGSIKPDGESDDDAASYDVGGFVVTMPWRDGIASVSCCIDHRGFVST
jgi:hypothetical protein